jgi:predicted aspartyl protease
LPQRLAKRSKLLVIGKRTVETAKGKQTLKLSYCLVGIKDEKHVSEVLISKTLNEVPIGAITLKSLRFKVSPVTGKSEKVEAYL